MLRLPTLLALTLAVGTAAAWSSAPSPASAAAHSVKVPKLSPAAQRGLVFAQARCAGCHGIAANASSPNPESPPFDAIANQPGLTFTTLRDFLRDSHNYPAAMNFTIEPRQVGDLTHYMLTLRSRNYRPRI